MKKFLIALTLVFTATVFTNAQGTTAAIPAAGKIGIVNPLAFTEDKAGAGIARLKTALKTVNDELKPLSDRMQADMAKFRTVAAEIERLRNTQGTTQAALQAKAVEGQDLETTIKRSEEDLKARYDRRYREVVAPVYDSIFTAMNEYAKQKGYAVILNGVKLEQDNILMGFDDRYDVTADFITFYNARPATR